MQPFNHSNLLTQIPQHARSVSFISYADNQSAPAVSQTDVDFLFKNFPKLMSIYSGATLVAKREVKKVSKRKIQAVNTIALPKPSFLKNTLSSISNFFSKSKPKQTQEQNGKAEKTDQTSAPLIVALGESKESTNKDPAELVVLGVVDGSKALSNLAEKQAEEPSAGSNRSSLSLSLDEDFEVDPEKVKELLKKLDENQAEQSARSDDESDNESALNVQAHSALAAEVSDSDSDEDVEGENPVAHDPVEAEQAEKPAEQKPVEHYMELRPDKNGLRKKVWYKPELAKKYVHFRSGDRLSANCKYEVISSKK